MGRNYEKADHFRGVFFQNLLNGEEVAERFAHFLLVDIDKTVVHPVFDKRFAGRPFTLGDLVLMVWKDQILAAAIDIK